MLATLALQDGSRSCRGGCRGPLALIYLRGYEEALGELAALLIRGNAEARALDLDALSNTRDEIETQVRRVLLWARHAPELHGADCEWLAELTEQKRRLMERVAWHTSIVSALARHGGHA